MFPGSSDVANYARTEIRAILSREITRSVTVAPQTTALATGTILGVISASGNYTPYAAANADGSQVAKVILAEDLDASTVAQIANVYISGIFTKNLLTGLDAAAISALGAREPISNLLVVPGC